MTAKKAASDKPTTLYHPTLRDAEKVVEPHELQDWLDAGWRKTKPDLEPSE